jgi:hypothetical protein
MVNLAKKYDVVCVETNYTLYGNYRNYNTVLETLAILEEAYGKHYKIVPAREKRTDLRRMLAEDVTGADWSDGYGLSGNGKFSYVVREVAQGKAWCVDVYEFQGKEGTYGFKTEDECLAFINGCERGEEI